MDTTANIADVDMGRTVQRVLPFPHPSPRSLLLVVPVPLVLTRRAIKWSKRAGVRKFDDEVQEKEAEENEGRRGPAKGGWRMRGKGE